jgi:2'-5' RNA ligase
MPEMIRGFIAFDINNELVLQNFKEVQGILRKTGADMKLVEPHNIHITIRFLGDIEPPMIEPISKAMKKVLFTTFNCEIRGLDVFPNLRYPRVVWAGMRKGADDLRDIFEQLELKLRQFGFRADSKGFSPHLTLARVKSGRNKFELGRSIQNLADFDFGVVKADCLRLKRSVLTPRGPIYSTLIEVCHQKQGC